MLKCAELNDLAVPKLPTLSPSETTFLLAKSRNDRNSCLSMLSKRFDGDIIPFPNTYAQSSGTKDIYGKGWASFM
jgi:hypothetical protein